MIARQSPFAEIDFELEIPGGHQQDGIFVWYGDGVHSAHDLTANLTDITPTILCRMGIPIQNHMDGKPLTGLFSSPPELSYCDWHDADLPPSSGALSNDDEAALQQRLRDLGYL